MTTNDDQPDLSSGSNRSSANDPDSKGVNPVTGVPHSGQPQRSEGLGSRDDPAADTAMFQAFQDAADEPVKSGTVFRIASLAIGVLVLAAIVFALLQ